MILSVLVGVLYRDSSIGAFMGEDGRGRDKMIDQLKFRQLKVATPKAKTIFIICVSGCFRLTFIYRLLITIGVYRCVMSLNFIRNK